MKTNGTPLGTRGKEYTAVHRRRKKWLTAVTCLAAVVVFCTTYALILPAVTLEKGQELECTYSVHEHEKSCYDSDENLICGYADYAVHTHQQNYCYDADGKLVCELTEVKVHAHSASCYEEQQVLVCGETEGTGHVHGEGCYTSVRGDLTCQTGESAGHVHDASCYTNVQGDLVCQEEHDHTDNCYAWTEDLTCNQAEGEGSHQHSDDCYDWTQELTCNLAEGDGTHQHSEGCYETETVLTCEKPEAILHTHGADCFEDILDEDTGEVIGQELICGKLQVEEHQHDDACQAEQDPNSVTALMSLGEVPEALLNELAGQGIYPGTETSECTWTVYDTGDESTANIQAIVTLPEGAEVDEGYYLYIRKVAEDEYFYPDVTALKAALGDEGAYSDVQCYAIHWVHIYQDPENKNEWTYSLDTSSVLGDTSSATVQITYLKNETCLSGSSAHRKLMVLNSRDKEGTVLEDASTPTAVTATSTAYTGFTFTTNRGGPYVFVSKTLYEGYVSSVTVDKIIDGSDPFDDNDKAGNDSNASNQIVRTYDTIEYNLTINRAARSSTVTATEGVLEIEMTLDADITEAAFNTETLLFLGSTYTIEYLDKDGNVVVTQKTDGTYQDAAGNTKTVNDLVSGSTNGENSYTSAIVKQRLRGSFNAVAANEGANVIAGTESRTVGIQVLNAGNQSKIQPTIRIWFRGNEDNYGSENPGQNSDDVTLAEKVTDNEVKPKAVTVSAAARFNLEVFKNANVTYRSWFDSEKGNEVRSVASYTVGGKTVTGKEMYNLLEALGTLEENTGKSNPQDFTDSENQCKEYLNGLSLSDYNKVFENIRYGRITGYGITLQIYNDATGEQNDASKGFKGVSLPQGSISFDLALTTSVSKVEGNVDETQYYAQLWEYNENVIAEKGNQSKNMYWDYLSSTKYAAWAAPYNQGTGDSYCYNGGTWSLGGTNADDSYPFTVNAYDLNFLSAGLGFPTHKAGNSSKTDGYNEHIGSFSAGYVQVLNVFPRVQDATFTLYTNVTVKNLTVSTTDNQTCQPSQGDKTGYDHETNTTDNTCPDSIPLYSTGGMTKANAFCTAACFTNTSADFAGKSYFLGTDFWNTGYDASAFAGQDITLVGAARINAGDDVIKHMNILQLFDSKALSIDTSQDPPYVVTKLDGSDVGNQTILYAADPDYPQGYDTNNKNVMEYMSRVREEDLIYYESLDALKTAGYTCVGVLAELRNCTIRGEGGYGTMLKIPMKVSDDEAFLTKTVATVNTVRAWISETAMNGGTVSWKNGTNDPTSDKNTVDGYDSSYKKVENGFSYVKTEYENGQVTEDSNKGGYVFGATLLILGYKSTVDIKVDNGGDGTLPTYDVGNGKTTVEYHLQGIQAQADNTAGTPQETPTNLTVLAKLDTDKAEDATQRVAVAATGYEMIAASEYMQLVSSADESNCEVLESVEISTDPNNPTTVYYRLTENLTPPEGEEIEWTYYTIQVYATTDTNHTQVTFQLKNVTVNVAVPDITFDALIDQEAVSNNDRIAAEAYISGTSDVRAYAATNGNMDTVTIGIVKSSSSTLVKRVDKRYIEVNGVFTYTVTYANTGNEPVDVYLYDLLPDPDDIRGSDYDSNESTLTLRDISAELSGEGGFTADIQFYYSTSVYTDLYNNVRVFGGVDTGSGAEITDINARKDQIERMLGDTRQFNKLGTINKDNNHQFVADADNFGGKSDEEITRMMRNVTGIYAVIENLQGGKTLSITFTVQTEGNKAGDLYRNIANSWLGNASEPLTSNLVETTVLSRAISGVVWHDSDLDGVRDSDEALLKDVTCTLFKWNETSKQYEVCTTDVTGAEIQPVTTGVNGAYSFENLAAGEYVVAFSGDALSKYTGSTVYQVNGSNDSATNDGVALTSNAMGTNASYAGIDDTKYSYAIAYSLTDDQAEPLSLHTIEEIVNSNISLTNSVELYDHQDLGLVITGYELPETGGAGTTLFTIGGLLLMAGAAGCGYGLRRRRGRRAGR